MSLILATARAVITSLKKRTNELAATALLEEAVRAINGYAGSHWRAHSISELPDMIHELARDREDFKKMSIAYRESLAKAEMRLREQDALLNKSNTRSHESWCSVNGVCSCSDLDEDDLP